MAKARESSCDTTYSDGRARRQCYDFLAEGLDAALPFFGRAALPFFGRAANAPFLKIASLRTDWSVLHYVFKK